MKITLTSDGSRTLYSDRYDQTYHSASGAVSESSHVFLSNSGVAPRLSAGKPTRVLEIGFGTGLNFFLTADCALRNRAALNYVAIDNDLVPPSLLSELEYTTYLDRPEIVDAFGCEFARFEIDFGSTFEFPFDDFVWLTLVRQDATQFRSSERFDCIYLDAFSPEQNAELWTEAFLSQLYDCTAIGGSLATYCVKSEIQRRLKSVGYSVQTVPGPSGGKREVLMAKKEDRESI